MKWSRLYNPLMIALLRSPLHGLLSGALMLITVTGRKSSKTYTTPVNYVRDSQTLLVISVRQRTWWRNLRGGAPVTVRLQGRDLNATGEVLEDAEAVAEGLAALLRQRPQYARAYNVALDADGQPNADDVTRAAESRVLVRVRLA